MKIPIQQLEHKNSNYERPNQKWVCGATKQGKPCPNGPNGPGECSQQAQGECKPSQDANNRFHCNRASAYGGACTDGPLPDGKCCKPVPEYPTCQPYLSLRAKRRRLVTLTLILTITVLVLIFSTNKRFEFASPGELSSAHSGILNQQGESDCLACHESGNKTFSQWVNFAISDGQPHTTDTESQCLSCHFEGDEQSQSLARLIHNKADLFKLPLNQQLQADPAGASEHLVGAGFFDQERPFELQLASLFSPNIQNEDGTVNCMNCHQEHQGKDHDLKAITDNQCQSCHQEQFTSFDQGHPEFKSKHLTVQTIKFEHSKHAKYFDENKLDCLQCHQSDTQQSLQLLPFEQSCRGCHEQGSKDHHSQAITKDPIVMFQLPAMEFESDTLTWPEGASTIALPAMMSLLLLGDEDMQDALDTLYGDEYEGDFEYWSEEAGDEDKIVVANGIKQLLQDFTSSPKDAHNAIAARISKVLGLSVDDKTVEDLSTMLVSSAFTMQVYRNAFLPVLTDEDEAQEALNDSDINMEWLANAESKAWFMDNSETTVYYRPTMHSDKLLLHWMNAINQAKDHILEQDEPASLAMYESHTEEFKACSSCHVPNTQGWQGESIQIGKSGFTKFNHTTHLASTSENTECSSCHTLLPPAESEHHGNFSVPEKQLCATCHTSEKVANTCSTCHDYHMEEP